MTTTDLPRIVSRRSDPLQDELRHIRDLIFIRDLLAERGELSTELRKCDAVIDEARVQLRRGLRTSPQLGRRSHRWDRSEVAPDWPHAGRC